VANIFIGVNRGAADNPDNITEGASTGSTDIELRIDTGVGWTRAEADRAVTRLIEYLNDGRTSVYTL
jgi:hypothetical protein